MFIKWMTLNIRSSLISNSAPLKNKFLVSRERSGHYCGIFIPYIILCSLLLSCAPPSGQSSSWYLQIVPFLLSWHIHSTVPSIARQMNITFVKCVWGHNWRRNSRRIYQEVFLWNCFYPRKFFLAVVVAKKSSWSRWEGALPGSSPSLFVTVCHGSKTVYITFSI